MRNRAALAPVGFIVAVACGDRPLVPTEPTRPSTPVFDVATERVVIEGPFSLRDRIGRDFEPTDLNDRGDVAGSFSGGAGILPGDGGSLAVLPPIEIGGIAAPAIINELNEVGIAAGWVFDRSSGGTGRMRPLLWFPGAAPEIGPTPPDVTGVDASVINVLDVSDAGSVVGGIGGVAGPRAPYRWATGAPAVELLDNASGAGLGGDAVAINNAGLMAGYLTFGTASDLERSGALWSAAGALTLFPADAVLYDVNNVEQLAGRTEAGFCTLWDSDRSVLFQAPCPRLVFGAIAVNDLGHFLYRGGTTSDPTVRPRLWVAGTEPTALPLWPGAAVTRAESLNNRGMIVGFARPADFSFTEPLFWTYRLEPVPADELVEDLVDAVDAAEEAGVLGAGNANALRAKLDAASRHLAAGRCTPAAMVLEAFRSQVAALERSGALTPAEAASLRDAADAAIAEISATCGAL